MGGELIAAQMRRGDIFYADFSLVVGSEQRGRRPVLIIQNDADNRFSQTVIVAVIGRARASKKKLRQTRSALEILAREKGEKTLMKKFVLDGIAHYRLEQAIAAYRRGEIDLSAAVRHADTSVYHLLEELKARDITPEAATEKFLDGLRTLAELFGGSEAMNRTLSQLEKG